MSSELFAGWDLAPIADALSRELSMRRDAAAQAAAQLAPEGPGPGFRVSIYRDSTEFPAQTRTFPKVYPTWEAFTAALTALDGAAVEVALELLSQLDAEAAWPAAQLAMSLAPPPWKAFWPVIARALARVPTRAAFGELLAIARKPNCSTAIASSRFAEAGEQVLDELAANPVFAGGGDDPHDRIVAESLLRYLSAHQVVEGWETVVTAYAEHPLPEIRNAAGHALLSWGDARSLDVLLNAPSETDPQQLRFAAQAALRRDPATAIDLLGGEAVLRQPSRAKLAAQLLEQVGRDATSQSSRRLFEADPRYLELALAWVKENTHKDACQWVISAYPKVEVASARKRQSAPTRPIRAVRTPALTQTMLAARSNIERIVEVLRSSGYQFVNPDGALGLPDLEALETLTRLVGPIPRALEAAYEVIGSCDLRGSHPSWSQSASLDLPGSSEPVWFTDPLVLIGAGDLLDEAADHADDIAQWSLPLAPDDYGKAGYSGGTHVMLVPSDAEDGAVEGAPYGESLVAYLRHALDWGGFPGFQNIENPPTELLVRLRAVVR